MNVFLILGLSAVSQALLLEPFNPARTCYTCCGPPPCCNTCGLDNDVLSLVQPVVGTKFEGKEVVSAKRFLTDDLFGSSIDGSSVCLDCCGSHPCCHDCGLGDLFGHHIMSTEAPQSPEKEETYGTDFNTHIGHLIDTGFPTDNGHIYSGVNPTSGSVDTFLSHIDLPNIFGTSKPYYELLGKKK